MSSIWTRQFWRNTLELAAFGAATGVVFAEPDPNHPAWLHIATCAAGGALLWTAKSILSNPIGKQRATGMLTEVDPKASK